ncbi:GntR family transcriptional regulator [Allostella vacuolata]|nr:GntR family transcriptional regulator [Stella vacuolata]
MNCTPRSRLQGELVRRIVGLIQADGLAPGTRITEVGLADRLTVSRTPVRTALAYLIDRGLVERREDRSLVIAAGAQALARQLDLDEPSGDLDRLFVMVAQDRIAGRLPDEVSESDLMRRYSVSRRMLQRLLDRLAELVLVERKPGHGWRFRPTIADAEARAESYRFRLLVEPAALAEPGFRLDRAWLAEIRERHEAMMAAPWRETSSIALFEMNADFHEGLAAASGNRYFLSAVQQQNRLRRFTCYDWVYGRERMVVSCREHLEIMDRLELGDREIAAALLRRHLDGAAGLNRGLRSSEGRLSAAA